MRGPTSPPPLQVGLFIPTSGAAGIWGPSCRACAILAAQEINQFGGIHGREVRLRIEDAGGAPDEVAARAADLVRDGAIDAIVGMHISAVREALVRRVGSRLPYIYTPLYEGGERTPGVFAIGETPEDQLLPALDWLARRYRLRRWALIGNDYVWPYITHALAKRHLAGTGAKVVGERYLPFDVDDFDALIAWLRRAAPDAVLLSLVGQASVEFNRAFGRAGLSTRMLRFSCAIEENVLLGIGAANTDAMFVSAGYFGNLSTRQNGVMKERYYTYYGDSAPTLNALGESLYEGMHFLDALLNEAPEDWRLPRRAIDYGGARGAVYGADRRIKTPTFLAEARGNQFGIVTELCGR